MDQQLQQLQQPQEAQIDLTILAVIQTAVQAAIMYQGENQHNFPTSGKNYKMANQVPFHGKAEQIESFLQECKT